MRRDDIGVWLGGVALVVLVAVLASIARSWAAPVAAVAVLGLGAYYARVFGLQVGLVVLLIVTSIADHFTFSAGPVAVRAEQVAALAAVAALAVTQLREGRLSWLKPNLPEGLLLAWFACNLVSSVLSSPDRRLSAKIIALIAVCSLGFFLPRRLLAGPLAAERMETVTRWLLIAFASEAGYAFITYLIHVLGPTISLTPNPASGHLSAFGTLWEQNVLGGFAAAGAVGWVYLGPRRFRRAWLGLAVCSGGLVDSLTRAAWLAAAIVGALGIGLPKLRRRLDLTMLGKAAFGGLVIAAATLAVDHIGKYTVVLPSSGNAGPPNSRSAVLNVVDIAGRFNQLAPVWEDVRGHLVLGRGTASFESLYVVQGVPQHVASLPLLVFNDTGLVGLALFIGFAGAIFFRARSRGGSEIVVALGQVAIVVGLANLATETTELMVGWLLIGILMAAADLAPDDAVTDIPTEQPQPGSSVVVAQRPNM